EDISDIRDESDRNGMRIVIELKRDANAQVVLNRLFAQTQMQTTFAVTLLALVDNQTQPRILSLKQILQEYLTFQEDVITRRTRYELKKARERAHLLEGLLIAQDNIDEVIRIIRESYDDAKERLMARFGLDEVQTQAILEMRLRQLQGLDREKLKAEYDEIENRIRYYEGLLADPEKIKGVLKEELTEVMKKYGDERLTEIQDVEDDIDIEDLIEEETCVYTLSHSGFIKRMPADAYRAQKRGGRGITGMTTKEEDYVETIFTASSHDYILFFTNTGRVYRKKGYLIPEAGRTAKGTNIINVIPTEPGEQVNAMISIREFPQDKYLVFVTRQGTVKRMCFSELKNVRNVGIRALNLDEGDELIYVCETDGEQRIVIATHDGMAICFNETDVRPMGRTAVGVRGIMLRKGDYCVGAARSRGGAALLTVTENGYGKKTPLNEYLRAGVEAQRRGGIGIRNYQVTEKTGPIAAVKMVDDSDDVFLISSDGIIIRMAARDINEYGRVTQGVRVMRVAEGERVISLTRAEAALDREEEADSADAADSAGAGPAAGDAE
ncbi:MAG: DNA gyrase subunit A, partial [Oscillospiraceae bacterium]|nr:DNA gyrase subunit A [Oscillospiraceae bacterium]